MIIVDIVGLSSMAAMLLLALGRGAASVSRHELWHAPAREPHGSELSSAT